MSRPTDIYEHISRALLENVAWQLGAPKGSELHVLHTSVVPIVD